LETVWAAWASLLRLRRLWTERRDEMAVDEDVKKAEADVRLVWDLSTRMLLESIDPLASANDVAPADMLAAVTVVLGRIAGKMGKPNLNCDQQWANVVTYGKVLFKLGFESERQN